MHGPGLDPRTQLSIELAMTAGCRDVVQSAQQEARARALGMSGAEIDAARRGWSFDAQASIAVTLATALGEDEGRNQQHRQKALMAGLSPEACSDVEVLARRFRLRPLMEV